MKKRYTKMTVQCERFALNEAISAGCSLNLDSAGAICEDCHEVGIQHSFKTFTDGTKWIGIANESANSVRNPGTWQTSSCDFSMTGLGGVVDGITGERRSVLEGDVIVNYQGRAGFFDPIPANQSPATLWAGDPALGGYVYTGGNTIIYGMSS